MDEPLTEEPTGTSSPAPPPPERRRLGGWLLLLVFAVAALVHVNTLANGFTWDDHWLITDNPRISDPAYAWDLFTQPNLWRPVKRLTLMADHALWGPTHPAGFHATNVLLHALASVLLCLLAGKLGLQRAGALAVGLLFAVHPAHVEAIANISTRKEPLALLFSLLAFLAWLEAREAEQPRAPVSGLLRRIGVGTARPLALRRAELIGWAGLCYLLAMLSKEVAAVMLPAVIVFHELATRPGAFRRKAVRLAALLVPVVLVLGLFTARGYLGSLGTRFGAEQILWVTLERTSSYGTMLLAAVKAFACHVGLLVWPSPLYADRAFDLPSGLADPSVLAGLALLIAWVVALVWTRRRSPVASTGLAWFGLNLLPVLNVVPLTFWLFAERFAYVPSAGALLAVGALVDAAFAERLPLLPRGEQRRVALPLLALVLVVFSALSFRQNTVWKDDQTLWEHTLKYNPNSFLAWHAVGVGLEAKGLPAEAEAAYRRAIAASPRFAEPHYGLARLLLVQGRLEEAITEARFHADADKTNAASLMVIGNARFHQRNFDAAITAYQEAFERKPDYEGLRFNLASALHLARRNEEVLALLGRTAQEGDEVKARFVRGLALAAVGDPTGAVASYRAALELDPSNPEIAAALASLLAQMGSTE